jgi:membrane-associated protease RseP (regulator of RpoE activity)
MIDTQVPTSQEAPDAPVEEGEMPGKLGLVVLLGAVVALGVLGGLPALLIVGAIVVMIFFHELGHYLTAKASGMKVTEFFLGFGPRIWSFRRGETEYGVKVIPAGAYVKIIGMHNLDDVDPADEERTYRAQSYPRRLSVALAGSAMHFLMALVLAFVALTAYGLHDPSNWRVDTLSTSEEISEQFRGLELDEDFQALLADGQTPALAAGLEPGDTIVAGNGAEFDDFTDVQDFILEHPGAEVTFTVERDGETFDAPAQIGMVTDGEHEQGFLGFSHDEAREPLGAVEASRESFGLIGTLVSQSVQGIGRFFTPSGLSGFADSVFTDASEEAPEAKLDDEGISAGSSSQDGRVMSIVGAARFGAEQTSSDGLFALLSIMVVLNIFIGLFNLIPLPPFDGGHVAVATYERIREIGRGGRRYYADYGKLLPVAYGVLLFMVTVGAMAIYADIFNWQDFG